MSHAGTAADRIICTQCGHIERKPSWLREWLPWCLVVGAMILITVVFFAVGLSETDRSAVASAGMKLRAVRPNFETRFSVKMVLAGVVFLGLVLNALRAAPPWKKCRACGAKKCFVPLDSPEGRQAAEDFGTPPDRPAGLSTGANLLIALAVVGGTIGLILLFAWWKLD